MSGPLNPPPSSTHRFVMGIVTFIATYHYQHLERQFSVPSVDEIFNEVATLAAAHLPWSDILFTIPKSPRPSIQCSARRDSSFFIEKIIQIEIQKNLFTSFRNCEKLESRKINAKQITLRPKADDHIVSSSLEFILSLSDRYAWECEKRKARK